ncbi:MAG: ABC transporter permease [Desulfobulbaceae bacterium]|jgi:lipopolysaccharide transport system permease protein/teichoic acid transport system permease protein
MKFIKMIYIFLKDVFKKRTVIYELARRDFRQQYLGSYLGLLWMFLEPLVYIFVLYVVISIGFKTSDQEGTVPYIIYLISGIVTWSYFSANLIANTGIIKNFSFLVKKVDFRISILPFIKLLSSIIPHVFLVIVTVIISWKYGYRPSLYLIQLVYYFFSMFVLLIGLGWLTSSTSLFVKDVANIIRIIVQFGFWITPVLWNIERVPEEFRWIIKLNPMCYIVNGYRDSIIMHVPFWALYRESILFWLETSIILLLGIVVFRKLKPHFAEVV